MKLRPAIEPDVRTAELRYPDVLNAILDYTRFCDEYGDEDTSEYRKLETRLHDITGKDIGKFNLSEWWEEEGAEPLAFRISLPDPIVIDDLSREEVNEIVLRLKNFNEPEQDQSFFSMFYIYLDIYYHAFLKLNCRYYDVKLFQRNRDKSGNYFEYNAKEIMEKMVR